MASRPPLAFRETFNTARNWPCHVIASPTILLRLLPLRRCDDAMSHDSTPGDHHHTLRITQQHTDSNKGVGIPGAPALFYLILFSNLAFAETTTRTLGMASRLPLAFCETFDTAMDWPCHITSSPLTATILLRLLPLRQCDDSWNLSDSMYFHTLGPSFSICMKIFLFNFKWLTDIYSELCSTFFVPTIWHLLALYALLYHLQRGSGLTMLANWSFLLIARQ
jgi:hypothetical protein